MRTPMNHDTICTYEDLRHGDCAATAGLDIVQHCVQPEERSARRTCVNVHGVMNGTKDRQHASV